MTSNLERVKNKILNFEIPIGTAVTITNPVISEIYCKCGFDFIWIDGEHGPIDYNDIDLHIMTIRNAGVAPFIRVPGVDPLLLKKVLDMGPAGIIFPQLKTVDEVNYAVSCCKYPPKGIRGFGPRRAIDYGKMDLSEYLQLSNNEPWIIIQIEHIEAVKNLKEILKIDGIDSIVIGPSDLTFSMELPNKTDHPEAIKIFDIIAENCNEAKIPFGISLGTSNIENIKAWIRRGVSWIQGDADISHLLNGGINSFNIIKKAIQETLNIKQ